MISVVNIALQNETLKRELKVLQVSFWSLSAADDACSFFGHHHALAPPLQLLQPAIA